MKYYVGGGIGWDTYSGERALMTAGRTETTWRKTAEKEMNKAEWKSWNAAKVAAQNRKCWIDSVAALCTYWGDEKRS